MFRVHYVYGVLPIGTPLLISIMDNYIITVTMNNYEYIILIINNNSVVDKNILLALKRAENILHKIMRY